MESLSPEMKKMQAVNPFFSTRVGNESHHLSVVCSNAPKIFTKIEDAATFFVEEILGVKPGDLAERHLPNLLGIAM